MIAKYGFILSVSINKPTNQQNKQKNRLLVKMYGRFDRKSITSFSVDRTL